MPRAPGPPTTQDQAGAPFGKPPALAGASGPALTAAPTQRSSRSQKITRAKAPAESRMWLLGAAAGGAGPASWSGAEGASGEARWHHRDAAGPARLREREAVQGYGQRYFRSPHFRLRCSRC